MKLQYIGSFVEGVDIVLPDNSSMHVGQGETVEVGDELGQSLLEQAESWKAAKGKGD